MSIKRMLMLASMALAAILFAAPAAQAGFVWTHNHTPLEDEDVVEQEFKGFLEFTTPPPAAPVHTTFGCEVTVEIAAEGPSGGKVITFEPTTASCVGTGVLAGCELVHHTTNIAKGWAIDVDATPATVKATGDHITILNVYDEGCAVPGTHLEFEEIQVTPTLNGGGTITELAISGTATNGFTVAGGSVFPENGPTLGLQ